MAPQRGRSRQAPIKLDIRPGDSKYIHAGTFKPYKGNRHLWFNVTGQDEIIRVLKNIQQVVDDFITGGGDTSDLVRSLKNRQIRRWQQNYNSWGAEYKRWVMYKGPRETKTGGTKTGWNSRYKRGTTLHRTLVQKSQHTAVMEESAESTTSGNKVGVSWRFHNKVEDGYYAVSHHTGYTFGPKNQTEVPLRRIWDLDDEDERLAHRKYSEWAHKKFNKMVG